MLNDEQFEAIWEPQRLELSRDVVGVWMLVGAVNEAIAGLDSSAARELVLDIIERAVRDGEAEAATHDVDGSLMAWTESPREVRDRVEREWIALGRDPHPGEILWLQKAGGYPPPSPEQRPRFERLRRRLQQRLQTGRDDSG